MSDRQSDQHRGFGDRLTTPSEFRFRLNGEIMPEIFIQRALIHGEPVGEWQVVVDIDGLGKITLDDNSDLWDSALPQFVIEFRDETSWALLPQTERHASVDKGWYRTTPHELLGILESAGVINIESINKFFEADE